MYFPPSLHNELVNKIQHQYDAHIRDYLIATGQVKAFFNTMTFGNNDEFVAWYGSQNAFAHKPELAITKLLDKVLNV